MKEYGGYIEFENYHGNMLHEGAISLNCGRNALAYLCEAKKIKNCIFRIFFVRLCLMFARKMVLNMVTIISTKCLNRCSIRHLVKMNGSTS